MIADHRGATGDFAAVTKPFEDHGFTHERTHYLGGRGWLGGMGTWLFFQPRKLEFFCCKMFD